MIGQLPSGVAQTAAGKAITSRYDPKRAPTRLPTSAWPADIQRWAGTERARIAAARAKDSGSLYDATQYGMVTAPPGFKGTGLRKLDQQMIDAILRGWAPEQVELLKQQGLKTHQWLQESLFPAGKGGGLLGKLFTTGVGLAFPAAGVATGIGQGLGGNPLSAAKALVPTPSIGGLLARR